MAAKKSGGGLKWIIILVVLFAAGGGGWYYYQHQKSDALQYESVAVEQGDLTEVVTATGSLNPVVSVTVGSQVSGIINKINVDFNSVVSSNEIIAQIDPSTYRSAVEQAEADLANSQANLELQQVETRRSAELFTNNLVSSSDNDTAIATLHEAEAMVKIKQAALDTAEANLGYCDIRSPVDGVVISRAVDVGQTVASSFNTPTLFTIANDLTKMQIDSSVAEADVGGIIEGQGVDFTVDAYPTRDFHGSVTQVRNSPTNANNVVTYDCVVSVTNTDYKLKPGMTANMSFIIAQKNNVLNIPNSVLRFHPPEGAVILTNTAATDLTATNNSSATGKTGGHHSGHTHAGHMVFHTVYVLSGTGEDEKLTAVQIRTGISDGINTEVVSGLNEGDNVVTGLAIPDAAPVSKGSGGNGFPRMH